MFLMTRRVTLQGIILPIFLHTNDIKHESHTTKGNERCSDSLHLLMLSDSLRIKIMVSWRMDHFQNSIRVSEVMPFGPFYSCTFFHLGDLLRLWVLLGEKIILSLERKVSLLPTFSRKNSRRYSSFLTKLKLKIEIKVGIILSFEMIWTR